MPIVAMLGFVGNLFSILVLHSPGIDMKVHTLLVIVLIIIIVFLIIIIIVFALFWSWRITYRRSIELRSLDPNPDDIVTFRNSVWIQSSPQICDFLPVYSLYHLPWYLPQHVFLNYVPNRLSVPLTPLKCGHREKCAPKKFFCQLIRFWSFDHNWDQLIK